MRVALAAFAWIAGGSFTAFSAESAEGDAKPSTPVAASLRLFSGTVISSTDKGAIIECKPPAARAQLNGTDAATLSGRFFLRGTPELLAPSADVQFLAIEDGVYRYTDFFKTVATMPALRFVKWEKPAPVATPTPQPVVKAQPAEAPQPRSTNPTPRLKGTMLDLPPRRLAR